MRYCISRHNRDEIDKVYRAYLTEAVKVVTENQGGSRMAKSYSDLIKPQKVETRTEAEVKAHMKGVLERLAVNE